MLHGDYQIALKIKLQANIYYIYTRNDTCIENSGQRSQ